MPPTAHSDHPISLIQKWHNHPANIHNHFQRVSVVCHPIYARLKFKSTWRMSGIVHGPVIVTVTHVYSDYITFNMTMISN